MDREECINSNCLSYDVNEQYCCAGGFENLEDCRNYIADLNGDELLRLQQENTKLKQQCKEFAEYLRYESIGVSANMKDKAEKFLEENK